VTIDAAVLIGEGPDSLEGTKVTTPAGVDLFREGVVISDPEIPGARAEVRQMGTNLTTDDWGLVTHSVIQGFSTAQGGEYHDVKVTPSGALTVEAVVTGVVSVEGTVNIAEPVTVDGTVSLSVGTLAALETINIGNTVAVSATDFDIRNLSSAQDSVTVTGSVNVGNFPTTQQVSGTVALDSATLAALETTTVSVNNFPATQAVSGTVALDSATLTALESITVQNGAGAAAVNIQDGGNSITVDGSVNVGNFPATQAVSGTVALDSTTLAALETIQVGNFPATQAVSGTVTVTQATAANLNATVSGTVTANLGTLNGAATAANQTTGNASLSSLDAKTPDESGTWGYNSGTAGTLTVAANKRILAITATAGALLGASMTINGGQTITIPAGASITIAPRANLTAPTLVFTSTASYFVEFIE